MKSYLVKLLIFTSAVLTICLSRSLFDTYTQYQKIGSVHKELEEKLVFEQYENSLLKQELHNQKHIDTLYENIARNELKMVYQDEEVYIIKLP